MSQQDYDIIQDSGHAPIKMWTRGVPVEGSATQQLRNLASLPFIHSHVAAMPDVHWGMGATVGSVIATKGAIIPAAVGVDIGCGMMAVRTSLTASDLPDNLHAIRSAIEAAIPHGRSDNGGVNDVGAHSNPAPLPDALAQKLAVIISKHPKIAQAAARAPNHAGTLGTGNHFIEICLDESYNVWVMLHSGSRGIGNRIGSHFIQLAKEDMRRWFINLPDADLAYIPQGSRLFDDYREALEWAQRYARHNRETMMTATVIAMRETLDRPILFSDEAVQCHHNYVAWEKHFGDNVMVTRKGPSAPDTGNSGSSPAAWARDPSLCAGRATGNRSSHARTARAA